MDQIPQQSSSQFTKKHFKIAKYVVFALFLLAILYKMEFSPYTIGSLTGSWIEEAEKVNTLAIQKKDIGICDKIYVFGYIDGGKDHLIAQCKNSYAAAFPEENICINSPGSCDLSTIIKIGNPVACFGDAYCVSALAYSKGDLGICDSFLTGQEGDKSFLPASPLYNLTPSQKCKWYISQGTFSFPREKK